MSANIEDSIYCTASATLVDLPDIPYSFARTPQRMVRPTLNDIEVISFPQGWGSTALGFGGVGGQAMTEAQTTVVICLQHAAVYFGRRLAYVVSDFNTEFVNDLSARCMKDVRLAHRYRKRAA